MPEVRHGQLWPTQSQFYKLFLDLSCNEQEGIFATHPAGRVRNAAYNDELVTCSL